MDPLDTRFDKLNNASRTGYLIGGFIAGTLTIEERDELDAWVLENDDNMQLFEDMTDDSMVDKFMQWLATRDTEARLIETKQRLKFKRKPRIISWWRYAAAACLLAMLGIYIYIKTERKQEPSVARIEKQSDILPGASVAELHLPGGKIVKLNGVRDTVINGIHINNGEAIYANNELDTAIHEILIPRKGFFKLILPDGSKVWLNSESSIRYPGAFIKDKREVSVTGETFFEVAKDKTKPFIVSVGEVKVQAVGTEFNINDFDKKITLAEGSVLISKKNKEKLLRPREQMDAAAWNVSVVETDAVLAWTQNKFRFKNLTIEEIMQQVQRWYDVEVVYDAKINDHLNAGIDREVPLSAVLRKLEGTGLVHFNFDGKTIVVKK
ncbi:MAG: FecR domain-containing protein [Chitinophagaceae bacterium]